MELNKKHPYTYLDAISGRFRQLYKGKKYAEIADLTGLSDNTIQLVMGPKIHNLTTEVLVRMVIGTGVDLTSFFEGIEYPDPEEVVPPNMNRFSAEDKERALAMKASHYTLDQIADHIGCSASTVSNWVRLDADRKK